MSALEFGSRDGLERLGCKGARAAEWLRGLGIEVPASPNTWCGGGGGGGGAEGDDGAAPLVARLGSSEYFLEDAAGSARLRAAAEGLLAPEVGVYPVLRADTAFALSGDGSLDVLTQCCSVNFAALELAARPVIMTLMLGVAVLVVPQPAAVVPQRAEAASYRIWCDPTFGAFLEESVGMIVVDCGGELKGMSV